jgi:hypothetical protein
MAMRSLLRPLSLFNPVSRIALATFAWNHRHEVMRWGRSLYEQLVGQQDVSPQRAVLIGRVLAAVASDEKLRNAPQLRRVSLRGDVVDLDVDERWPALPRLIERVERVSGVRSVVVNGAADTTARRRTIDV